MKAILEKRQVGFQFTAARGSHNVQLEPYRIAYCSGFWYLIGNEPATGILKRYALDRVSDLQLSKTAFGGVPKNMDAMLHGSANFWFSEEKIDGALVVSFRVGQYESIRNLIKNWIPNIIILAPEDFKTDMLQEMKDWIIRQS